MLRRRIARESGGNPFFLHELARYIADNYGTGQDSLKLTNITLAR